MATYKLIQDIEAEDHILGPLSLRQFIFALVATFCLYMCFLAITKKIYFLLVPFGPSALFFVFFAFPWGRDQPTEIWALAHLRFLFKPRRRVWDQTGIREMVTITVPKTVEPVRSDGLSQTEVQSRLKALSKTLDSRGWAVRGVEADAFNAPSPADDGTDTRLVGVNDAPKEVPAYEVRADDDMMDAANNPIAQQFDQMIDGASQNRRQELMERMKNDAEPVKTSRPAGSGQTSEPEDYWFMNPALQAGDRPGKATTLKTPVQRPADGAVVEAGEATPGDEALMEKLRAQQAAVPNSFSNMKIVQPLGSQSSQSSQLQAAIDDAYASADAQVAPAVAADDSQPVVDDAQAPPEPTPDPAIISLAHNDDLNVATLAREANRVKINQSQGEVVIQLH